MPGAYTLTTAASLQCPHGGSVQVVTSNTRAMAGSPIAVAGDMPIVGCPFQIPAVVPIPSPCVVARWIVPDMRVTAAGTPTLSQTSVALCFSPQQVPQGPVVVASTQTRTQSS
jgi:hypothetical protein